MSNDEQPNNAILRVPPSQLPIIQELKDFMEMMQIKNLNELLEYQISDLLKIEGFGYRCLKSLYQVLEENGCEQLLKDE